MNLALGSSVRCADGPFGELADVLVDPVSNRVTHLVVRSAGLDGVPRLVPIALAGAPGGEQKEIVLQCTLSAAAELEPVQSHDFLRPGDPPPDDPEWDVGAEWMLAAPIGSLGLAPYEGVDASYDVVYDRIPKGEAEIRRASVVIGPNGRYVGDINGFVLDITEQITHVVIEHGFLWRRRKVAIPIDSVESVQTDTVTLRLNDYEVDALPSERVHRWF